MSDFQTRDWYDLSMDERDERIDDPCLPEPWELEETDDEEDF